MERTPRSYKVQSKTWIDRIEAILLSYGRRIPVDALHALNSRFLPPRLQKFVRLLHSKEHLTRELLPTDERKRMVGDLVALLSDLSSRPSSAEEEEGKGEEDYINSEEEDFTAVGDILPKTFDVRHWERRLIHDAGVSRMLELASIETQERERSGYDYEKEGIEEVAGSVTTYRSLNRNRHLSWEKIPSNDSVPVHSTPVKKEEDEEDSLEEPPAEDKRPPSGDLYLRDPPKALIDLLTQIMAGEERSSPAPSQSSSSYIPLYKKERQERVSKGDEEKVEHQQWLHRVAQRMIATASSSATADLTFEEDLTDEKKVKPMTYCYCR